MWEVIQGLGGFLGVALPTWGLITWIARKTRFPANELWWELESIPILSIRGSGMVTSIGDVPVENPHQATLHVWSVGTADIPTTSFDGGVPITLTIDRLALGPIRFAQSPGSKIRTEVEDDRIFRVGPGLVRKRFRCSWTFVTDGIAAVDESHALYNSTLQSAAKAERMSDRVAAAMGLVLILTLGSLFLIVGFAVAAAFSEEVRSFMRSWVAFAFIPLGLGLGTLTAISSIPSRWARAQRKRGASGFARHRGGDV